MQNHSLHFGKTMAAIGLVAAISVGIWYAIDGWRWSYLENLPDATPLAQKLVSQKRSAEDCYKTYQIFPSYPSLAEAREYCIMEYAILANDPAVCERLMPSRYGLDCVLGAMKNDQCSFYGNFTVSWGEGKATLRECQTRDLTREKRGDQCCTVATASFLRSFNDCSSLSGDPVMFDECQFHVAFKNKDPVWCKDIKDPNMHSACVVSAEALKKDPSICSGCVAPIENIENLPD